MRLRARPGAGQCRYFTLVATKWFGHSPFPGYLMRRFLAAATLALLAACGNGGALEPNQLSAIRLYNGSFDSPAVNVFLRGTVLSQGLAFGHGQFHVFVQPGT